MSEERVTPSFYLSEFFKSETAARRGIDNTPKALHLANIRNLLAPGMQRVRELLGHPVIISSGFRSRELNAAVGGSNHSQHSLGRARCTHHPQLRKPPPMTRHLTTITTLVGMLALGLLLLAPAAHAQSAMPPCWPKQLGSTGSSYRTGTTVDGRWVSWVCIVKGRQQVFGFWGTSAFRITHPDTTGLTTIKTAVAYWNANVGNSDTAALQRLRAASRAAFPEVTP